MEKELIDYVINKRLYNFVFYAINSLDLEDEDLELLHNLEYIISNITNHIFTEEDEDCNEIEELVICYHCIVKNNIELELYINREIFIQTRREFKLDLLLNGN